MSKKNLVNSCNLLLPSHLPCPGSQHTICIYCNSKVKSLES